MAIGMGADENEGGGGGMSDGDDVVVGAIGVGRMATGALLNMPSQALILLISVLMWVQIL